MPELLDFARPHVLRDRAEYDAAVREIDRPLDEGPPTVAGTTWTISGRRAVFRSEARVPT